MEKAKANYIHGSQEEEQVRLSALNDFLNKGCLEKLPIFEDAHIIDVGSGLGQFSRLMASRVGELGRVVGVERDPQQWQKATALAEEDGEEELVDFRLGDAYELPLKAAEWGSFDMAFSRFVLEHLGNPSLAVAQMAKAVKNGGRVILTDDDHSTYRLSPEPPGFSLIWSAYIRSYERIGNDPFIGRRLTSLLYESGLRPSRLTSVFFGACAGETTFPIISDNLIGILEGAKELMLQQQLITSKYFEESIASIKKWQQLPDAALSYSIDWAEGVK